jgi:hypothetical protein
VKTVLFLLTAFVCVDMSTRVGPNVVRCENDEIVCYVFRAFNNAPICKWKLK